MGYSWVCNSRLFLGVQQWLFLVVQQWVILPVYNRGLFSLCTTVGYSPLCNSGLFPLCNSVVIPVVQQCGLFLLPRVGSVDLPAPPLITVLTRLIGAVPARNGAHTARPCSLPTALRPVPS